MKTARQNSGLTAGVVCLIAASLPPMAEARPPNFVIIMVDDLGARELPAWGHPTHQTPNLDQLARDGVRYRTCYATPNCSPTRVMLMTGRYGFRTGWFDFLERQHSPAPGSPQFDIGAAEITFADVLRQAGYATGIAGKWQLPGSPADRIRDCGFDTYCMWMWKHQLPDIDPVTGKDRSPYEPLRSLHDNKKTNRYWNPGIMQDGRQLATSPQDYGPDIFTDFVCRFIREHQNDPFLIYYPMVLCHNHGGGLPGVPDSSRPEGRTDGGLANNVTYIDVLVGRILTTIDDMELRENTWVFFTTDNGTADAGKGDVTEAGAGVPLIVRGPGVRRGTISDDLASLADLLPTMCELSGAPLPADRIIDGVSLVPSLLNCPGPRRDWVFSYLGTERMLRDHRWLLEGDGRFYDCGSSRNPEDYEDVTDSRDPPVEAARRRFEDILRQLPGPADDRSL